MKKCKIKWDTWFYEYFLESAADAYASTSLPNRLLISRIFKFNSTDVSAYSPVEISATYDSKTFSRMGYILIDDE